MMFPAYLADCTVPVPAVAESVPKAAEEFQRHNRPGHGLSFSWNQPVCPCQRQITEANS
jgi:hypothetical protein